MVNGQFIIKNLSLTGDEATNEPINEQTAAKRIIFMNVVLTLHSTVRWLILVIALIALVKFAMGWLQKQEFKAMDRGLMSGFTGLIDLQLLMGFILLFGLGGGFPRQRMEHAVTMIIVMIIAHLPARWRKSPDDNLKFRNNLAVIVVTLVLIVAGISVLPGNRWTL